MSFVVGKEIVAINMDDISLITTEDRYSQIYYQEKTLLIDEKLMHIIDRLDKNIFLFAHRNAIVNLNYIDQLKRLGLRKYVLIMKKPENQEVAVSRGSLADIRAALLR